MYRIDRVCYEVSHENHEKRMKALSDEEREALDKKPESKQGLIKLWVDDYKSLTARNGLGRMLEGTRAMIKMDEPFQF